MELEMSQLRITRVQMHFHIPVMAPIVYYVGTIKLLDKRQESVRYSMYVYMRYRKHLFS